MRSQAITLTKLVLTSTLKEVIQVERTDFIWGMTRLPLSSQTDCYFLSLNNTSYCLKRSLTGMWLSCTGKWHPPLVLQTRNMNHISHQTDLIFMLFVELISKWMRTLKKKEILASDSWKIYLRHKFHLFEWKSVRFFWYRNLLNNGAIAAN